MTNKKKKKSWYIIWNEYYVILFSNFHSFYFYRSHISIVFISYFTFSHSFLWKQNYKHKWNRMKMNEKKWRKVEETEQNFTKTIVKVEYKGWGWWKERRGMKWFRFFFLFFLLCVKDSQLFILESNCKKKEKKKWNSFQELNCKKKIFILKIHGVSEWRDTMNISTHCTRTGWIIEMKIVKDRFSFYFF